VHFCEGSARQNEGMNKARREMGRETKISKSTLTKSTKGHVMRKSVLVLGAIVAAVALSAVRVYADNASDIEQYYGPGYGIGYSPVPDTMVDWDNTGNAGYPVVNAIGSRPGVYGGHTFTYWVVMAQDSTGSMDLDVTTSSLNALATINGTTHGPALTSFALGDQITANMAWVPYHQIPELNVYTNAADGAFVTKLSSGNPMRGRS